MQIIIPMAGFGERFRKAGYAIPKTLIEIAKKPIFQHVIDLFPEEEDFLFIINSEDGKKFDLERKIKAYLPSAKVVSIFPHKKGPVWTLLQAEKSISDSEKIIVNYCDFSCVWDWKAFSLFVKEKDLDGAIPSYKGFHPHTLHSNYYAYLLCDQKEMVQNIQEKKPFTDFPQKEWASSGTYYFKSGKLLKMALKEALAQDLQVNGEYYVSLAYLPLLQQKAKIAPYPLEHFMQWGTPEDVRDFLYWHQALALSYKRDLLSLPGTLLMPMAGLGSRFSKHEEYKLPKPLIPVNNMPMVLRALFDLPQMKKKIFILRKEHKESLPIIQKYYPQAEFIILERLTQGQAATCLMAPINPEEALLIAACDNGMHYDLSQWKAFFEEPKVDIIVFGAKGYPGAIRNPTAYGWMQIDEEQRVKKVSVKQPFSNLEEDPIITGAFYFKKGRYFLKYAKKMIHSNRRINGEFYVDEIIQLAIEEDLIVKCVSVSAYLCWGTPEDLKTYQYWKKCFLKWEKL